MNVDQVEGNWRVFKGKTREQWKRLADGHLKVISGRPMNGDQVDGNWRLLKGRIREQWKRIADDHLKVINGRLEMLAGKIHQSYGTSVEEAERPVYEGRRLLEANDPYAGLDPDFDIVVEDRKSRTGS